MALKLCQAQERAGGAWQWEQPEGSIMFLVRSIAAFNARPSVFHAVAKVCFFGAPWLKPTAVISNCPYVMDVNVDCPSYPHDHIRLAGKGPDGRNWTAIAGPYWPRFAEAWAAAWDPLFEQEGAGVANHLSGFGPFDDSVPLAELLDAKDFSPSRHRTTSVIAQRVAAAVQPSKRALPSILPEGLGPCLLYTSPSPRD